MGARANDKSLKRSLQRFERRLESPVVPGELAQWLQAVVESCNALASELDQQIRGQHERMMATISREDPELLARVEQLRREDERLQDAYRELREQGHELAREAGDAVSHEQRLDEQVSSYVRQGLDFVISVRTQEAAMATWFLEAFDRDRGMGD